jgi:hypothetical protein
MHPYITLAIAEQRNADMRSWAATWRLAKAIRAGADRSRAQEVPAADCVPGAPGQRDGFDSARPLASSRR